MIIETALVELAKAGGTELFISSSESLLKKVKTAKDIKQLFINTGEFFVDYENDADQLFDDMANVLSKENMTKLANELKDEPGYKLKDRLLNSLMGIMKEYEIPHGMALSYANAILFAIMGQLPVVAPDKYDRAYQAEWKAEQEECFKELAEKFERLSECVELDDDFRIILFRIEALYTDKKPLVDNASVEIKRAFWKDFRWFSSNNMDWAVAECQQYGTVNSYLDLLYEFHENRNLTPEQLLEKMQRIDVMERGSINSMTDHYLKELLKPLQEQCIEDRDKCAKIAHIEIAFFYLLDWEDMKCFQKEIKHDPEMYAEMVSIIFRHDGDDPEERKTEEFRNYAQVIHRLFDMAKFCPCEENGTVSYDEIKVWVDKLIRILDSNHQKEMFGYVLGRLFAYAPKTADGHYPCEAVCQIIEEYGDESLLSEYRCELFNKREIFSPSAGRAEKDIAEGYKDNAEFLSIKYPKTADVFFKMSQSYVYDSDLERRRAENGYF